MQTRVGGVTPLNHPDIEAAKARFNEAYVEFLRQNIRAPASYLKVDQFSGGGSDTRSRYAGRGAISGLTILFWILDRRGCVAA
jgi:hypothetical protein